MMPNEQADEIGTILANTKLVYNGLIALTREMLGERRAINDRIATEGRDGPNDNESSQLQMSSDRLDVINQAIRDLDWDTLEALDKSAAVTDLVTRIQAINTDLSGTLNDLQQIAKFAATAAQVADILAQIVGAVAGLAAEV